MGNIGSANGFCAQTAGIWQFAGYVVMVLKILIPAILIIIGVGATGFGLNTATQVDIMAIVAATGFLVPILMIALVSLRLNNKF